MANPDIAEYHLLSAGTAAELSELVNRHLNEGYEIWGAPFSSPAGTVALLQAVIKRYGQVPVPPPVEPG
jgi:hypothetical protein